jgi:hypothetical protein
MQGEAWLTNASFGNRLEQQTQRPWRWRDSKGRAQLSNGEGLLGCLQ